jgi:hypothetical protein
MGGPSVPPPPWPPVGFPPPGPPTSFSTPAPGASGQAIAALILGIAGLVGNLGGCCCCVLYALAFCGPVAWLLAHHELRAIRTGLAPRAGEGLANAGRVMGIVSSSLLVLQLLAVLTWIGVAGFSAVMESLKQGPKGLPIPR